MDNIYIKSDLSYNLTNDSKSDFYSLYSSYNSDSLWDI